jgi:hypothetical protein
VLFFADVSADGLCLIILQTTKGGPFSKSAVAVITGAAGF